MTILHVNKKTADNTIWFDAPIHACKIRILVIFFENRTKPAKDAINEIVKGSSDKKVILGNNLYLQCSIVDSKQVMVDNKHLPVLAYIPAKILPDKMVYYYSEKIYLSTINCEYINSIRFWVTDMNNNKLLDDDIYPMHLTMELI